LVIGDGDQKKEEIAGKKRGGEKSNHVEGGKHHLRSCRRRVEGRTQIEKGQSL